MPSRPSRRIISTRNSYACNAELFARVAEEPFTAGIPALVISGSTDIIVFPPLDRHNQVSFALCGTQLIEVWGQGANGNRLAGRLVDATTTELAALDL